MEVWQGKGLRTHFAEVWQGKELEESGERLGARGMSGLGVEIGSVRRLEAGSNA
jgi:hypothetical protein